VLKLSNSLHIFEEDFTGVYLYLRMLQLSGIARYVQVRPKISSSEQSTALVVSARRGSLSGHGCIDSGTSGTTILVLP
jgi:hypothetical protein